MDRKHNLLEKVRSRLCNPSTKKKRREELSEKHMGNSNAKKKTRRLELGNMFELQRKEEQGMLRETSKSRRYQNYSREIVFPRREIKVFGA